MSASGYARITPEKIVQCRKDFHSHALRIISDGGLGELTVNSLCESVGVSPGSFAYISGESFTSFKNRIIDDEILSEEINNAHVNSRRLKLSRSIAMRKITIAAAQLSDKIGYKNVTMRNIANMLNVSQSMVLRHFSTKELHHAVVNYAVEKGLTQIIAQAIIGEHPAVTGIRGALKRQSIKELDSAEEIMRSKETAVFKGKKQLIIERTAALIKEHGADKVNRQQVADAVHLHRTTTYFYYSKFDDLIDDALNRLKETNRL